MKCFDCGKDTYTSYTRYNSIPLCESCVTKRDHEKLEEKSTEIKQPSDFRRWKPNDMSELFWMHLAQYIKEPNEHSIYLMNMAFMWACHDNVGLANSFSNALKWAKIDLYSERKKWKDKIKT